MGGLWMVSAAVATAMVVLGVVVWLPIRVLGPYQRTLAVLAGLLAIAAAGGLAIADALTMTVCYLAGLGGLLATTGSAPPARRFSGLAATVLASGLLAALVGGVVVNPPLPEVGPRLLVVGAASVYGVALGLVARVLLSQTQSAVRTGAAALSVLAALLVSGTQSDAWWTVEAGLRQGAEVVWVYQSAGVGAPGWRARVGLALPGLLLLASLVPLVLTWVWRRHDRALRVSAVALAVAGAAFLWGGLAIDGEAAGQVTQHLTELASMGILGGSAAEAAAIDLVTTLPLVAALALTIGLIGADLGPARGPGQGAPAYGAAGTWGVLPACLALVMAGGLVELVAETVPIASPGVLTLAAAVGLYSARYWDRPRLAESLVAAAILVAAVAHLNGMG